MVKKNYTLSSVNNNHFKLYHTKIIPENIAQAQYQHNKITRGAEEHGTRSRLVAVDIRRLNSVKANFHSVEFSERTEF